MVQYRWQAPTCPVYEWTDRGRSLYQAEWRTLRDCPEGRATVEAGYDAIHRCADATWFEWPKGSAPLFWNWGEEYQRVVWDGQPHFMIGSLDEPFMRKQAKAKDSLKHELMRAKVVEVRQQGFSSREMSPVERTTFAWTRGRRTSEWCTMAPVADSMHVYTLRTMGCCR
jgi:hypothetical protein